MKRTELQRNVSAYLFAMISTVVVCLLAIGILYVDGCARNTIMSADGMFYPLFDKIINVSQELFDL